MNKQIVGIIMGMFLISLVSAVGYDLIAGEPYTFDLNETYEYYSIVGNSTTLDLTITQEGTIITILTNKYSPIDSFEIIFFNSETEVIHHYTSGKTEYVDKEVLVEVPNYIDREVIKEVEVIKEIEVDKEVIGKREMTEKERKFFNWAIIIGYAIAIPSLIFVIIEKRKKRKSNSSQEENITEKEGKSENGLSK